VEARAGEAGAEEEEAVVAERWKVDLERFHHDGITGARDERLAVGVGLMASEPEREWTETTTTTATSGLAKEKKNHLFLFGFSAGFFGWSVVVIRGVLGRERNGTHAASGKKKVLRTYQSTRLAPCLPLINYYSLLPLMSGELRT
jgi:hypothetical protein